MRTTVTHGRDLLTQSQAQALARKTGKPVRVTGATTDSSTLTANPDGTLTLTETNMPVRTDVDGTWEPLNATLHRNADGTVSPAVTSSPLTLSGGGTGPLVSMTSEGHTLSLGVPWTLPAPTLSGATATYANVPAPGIDLEVTADGQGDFTDVLVVKNATAARSAALRSFTLHPSVTGGLVLRTDSHGNLTADDRGGHPFFEIPAATMWDSRTPGAGTVKTSMDPAIGRDVDLRDGQPVTSAAASPGEDARTATVGTRLSGGTLTYTPNMSLLAGKNTVFPVYIDPAAGSTEQYWAQVDNAFPTTTYPKPNPMQVGYNGWESPYFVTRSFVRESVPSTLDGSTTDVESATLYLTDEYAPTCSTTAGDEGVQVWVTDGISSSTDWDNQPSWNTEEDSKSFVHGYDSSCPAASEGFTVTGAMTTAAHDSSANVTFGIKADNESDEYGWKQFSDVVTLSTTYDKYPDAPEDPRTSPSTSCTASPPTTVGDGDVILYTTLEDPLGSAAGSLTASVYVTDDATGKAVTGSPFTYSGLGSGSPTTTLLKEATLKGLAGTTITEFSWYATVTDGTLTSGKSTTCSFDYDPSSPGAPSVTQEATSYTIGTPASFDVTPDVSGVTPTSYIYQVNGAAPNTATANSSGDATISVTPTSGADALTVTAVSAGGNVGDSATVIFTAAAKANAADGDMTGDGIPDLVTPGGGGTGLAPGMWLADGQAASGDTSGDGQVMTSATGIGAEGNGFIGDYSPNDFTGSQVITGLFNDNGLQDALAYYPSGTYAGQGAILDGTGDGTVLEDEDAANTTAIPSTTWTNADPNGDIPLQVANGYNADPNDNADYPDLITVSGDATNGYYLEYYQNGGVPGSWIVADQLSTTAPDGTMDWNDWQITTMQDPAGYADMFLYDSATGALYLWTDFTVDDALDTASYTQYELSSDWAPGTLSELRAANITGTGPALWAVTNTGAVTPWITSSLNSAAGTGTITAEPAQSLLSPAHAWRLGDGTSGTATTAADTGSGTSLPLTGNAGTTWNTTGLFNPDAEFDGTSGYLASSAAAFTPGSSYTISAWVDPAALGGTVFSQDGTDDSTVTVSSTAAGHWEVAVNTTAGGTAATYTTGTGGTARAGVWTDLTLTYDTAGGADLAKLYVNGSEALAFTDTAPPTGTGKFLLGAAQSGGAASGYFTGQIAGVQVWDTVAVPVQPATPPSAFVPVTPVRIMDTRSGFQIGPVTGPVASATSVTLPIDGNTTAGLPATGVTAAAVSITVTAQTASGDLTAYPAGASVPVTSTVNFTGSGNYTNNAIVPVGAGGDIAFYNASAGTAQIIVDLTGYFTTTLTTASASTYTPLPSPVRLFDTRNDDAAPYVPEGTLAADSTLTVPIDGNDTNGAGLPASGVTAVALNITAIPPSGASGFLQAYPDGAARPTTTNLNFDGANHAGTILIPVGADGDIDIYNNSTAAINLAGDLSGYFTTSASGQYYHPLDSTRIIDTRQSAPLGSNSTLTITNPASIPADNPTLVLNITATAGTAVGDLQAYPSSTGQPLASIDNYQETKSVPNLALVNTATGNAFTIANQSTGTVDVVIDTNGYFQ